MTIRVITVQFAVSSEESSFQLNAFRGEIQEMLYDEGGMEGAFRIVGATDKAGDEGTAAMFDSEPFDPCTIVDNGTEIITQERDVLCELWYCVDGIMPDDTLGPDAEASAPYLVFDIDAQTYIPGEFEDRTEAEAQAERMNAFRRKKALKSIVAAAHKLTPASDAARLCAGCAQTETESGVKIDTAPTCPGCVKAMADYIAELEKN